MATIADSLLIYLGLNSKDMVRGLNQAVNQVNNAARGLSAGADQLSKKAFSQVASIAKMVAAPVMGALSLGAVLKSYFGGVAQVAQMTGQYSKKMEEWRKKRAMLARYNREDIKLYKQGREALTKFQITMEDFSARLMRQFAPALRQGVEWLNKLSAWIDRNSNNIIRFLKVAASVIGTLLIPSLIKLGAAMLMNPITWLVVALGGLILVIDDLVVWLQGGTSALDVFWEMFGSRKEVLEKIRNLVDRVKTAIKDFAQISIEGIRNFASWLGKLWDRFQWGDGIMESSGKITKGLGQIWENVCGIAKALWEVFADTTVLDQLANAFNGAFTACRGILETIVALVRVLTGLINGMLTGSWDGFVEACEDAVNGAGKVLVGGMDSIFGILNASLNIMGGIAKKMWESMTGDAASSSTGIYSVYERLLASLDEAWEGHKQRFHITMDGLSRDLGRLWDGTVQNINNAFKRLQGKFASVADAFRNKLSQMGEWIRALKEKINEWATAIKNFFSFDGIVNRVKAAIRDLLSMLPDKVKDFIGLKIESDPTKATAGTAPATGGGYTPKAEDYKALSGWFQGMQAALVPATAGGRLEQRNREIKYNATANNNRTYNNYITINTDNPNVAWSLYAKVNQQNAAGPTPDPAPANVPLN